MLQVLCVFLLGLWAPSQKPLEATIDLPRTSTTVEGRVRVTVVRADMPSSGAYTFKLTLTNATDEAQSFLLRFRFFDLRETTEYERMPVAESFSLAARKSVEYEFKADFSDLGPGRRPPSKVKLVFGFGRPPASPARRSFSQALEGARVLKVYVEPGGAINAGPICALVDPKTGMLTTSVTIEDPNKPPLVPAVWYDTVDRRQEIYLLRPMPASSAPTRAQARGTGRSASILIPDRPGSKQPGTDLSLVLTGKRGGETVVRKVHPYEILVYTGTDTIAQMADLPSSVSEVQVIDKENDKQLLRCGVDDQRITGLKVVPQEVPVGGRFQVSLIASGDFTANVSLQTAGTTEVKVMELRQGENLVGTYTAQRPGPQEVAVSANPMDKVAEINLATAYATDTGGVFIQNGGKIVSVKDSEGNAVPHLSFVSSTGVRCEPNFSNPRKGGSGQPYLYALATCAITFMTRDGKEEETTTPLPVLTDDGLSGLQNQYTQLNGILLDVSIPVGHFDLCSGSYDLGCTCVVITCGCSRFGSFSACSGDKPTPHRCPTYDKSCSCPGKGSDCRCPDKTIICNPNWEYVCGDSNKKCVCAGDGCQCAAKDAKCPASGDPNYKPCGGTKNDAKDCSGSCCGSCSCKDKTICRAKEATACCSVTGCDVTEPGCTEVDPVWGEGAAGGGVAICAGAAGAKCVAVPLIGNVAGGVVCAVTSLGGVIIWGAEELIVANKCSNGTLSCKGRGQACGHKCGCKHANCNCASVCRCAGSCGGGG